MSIEWSYESIDDGVVENACGGGLEMEE